MNYKRQFYQRKNATHMKLSYRNDQKAIKTKLKLLVFRSHYTCNNHTEIGV